MRYGLITVAAGVLLLVGAAAGAGLAQAQDRDRGRGGAREAPRAAPQRAPRVERSRPQAQPRAQRAPERRAVERPRRERSAQPRERQRSTIQRAERQRDQKQRAERRQRDQQQQRVQRQQRDQQKAVERQRTQQQKQAAPKQDRPDRNQARNAERQGAQNVNRLQATNDQRVRVRQSIFRERRVDRITAKDFRGRITVGSRVDRRHHRHLHRLTAAILAFAPIYSGYSYLVVDDEICIVDPETYVIVDVIPASVEYAEGSQRPQLALSAEDMHFIYASVPKDHAADVRVRLALGAEIPGSVDLERFPDGVVERVPQIGGYRYIVVESDVVIVDPNDRSVALVITE